jgi:hypothetical protein
LDCPTIVQGPHEAISHHHRMLRIAQNAGMSVHLPNDLRDRTSRSFFNEQGQLKMVFWGGLGVF